MSLARFESEYLPPSEVGKLNEGARERVPFPFNPTRKQAEGIDEDRVRLALAMAQVRTTAQE